MELKRGVYFTIDSVIAGGIILVAIILASSPYVYEQPSIHLSFLSQDLIRVLGALNVEESNNEYVKSLIDDGMITNLDNTILEQVGEFWARDMMDLANKTVRNVTEPFVQNTTGFGLWINNNSIYERSVPVQKSLVSGKKIVSGLAKGETPGLTRQDPPTLWGPAIVEVRVWE